MEKVGKVRVKRLCRRAFQFGLYEVGSKSFEEWLEKELG